MRNMQCNTNFEYEFSMGYSTEENYGNPLIAIAETDCVYFAVRAESLNVIQVSISL